MGCTSSHVLPTVQYASLIPDTADLDNGLVSVFVWFYGPGPIFRAKGFEKEFVFTPNDKVKTMRDNYEYVQRRRVI